MSPALKILLVSDGLVLLAGAMLGPIYAVFVEEVGGDILTAGISFAIFSLVMGTLILVFGKIEDAFLKEKELWIALGYFLMAVGFFSYLFVKSPYHLFLVQAILGLGGAIEAPAYSSVYSRHLDHKKSAFQWGAWDAIRNFAAAAGALAGAALTTVYGFNILFIIMGFLAIISGLVVYFSPRERL
ncbi:MAG: MFS transporter [Candidatus Nealsonbacteria bacterium]|nr:MFS transporter [Candidatus Nealsonbacteria bacterium]